MNIDPKDAHNMMIMMSGICDESDLVEMVQNAIDGYKSKPSEETWVRFTAVCSMVLMKNVQLSTGGDKNPIEAAMGMMKDFREFDDVKNLLKPNKQ